ncbi:flavodoxin domain-containing protein [Rhodococcus chondri]|uniref:Flavodoxin domain-containing protein n=1 Tax=Rhodococcus chondri TaxID=3065941 RepID=A0ABU7JN86_9NOCA|nr:flavodoxin domain-containing protein [Rhodococcus sp. CC-R104]MEE2031177.1 flavodoxin domain-containing protein [Rhodococcus sp. CC-R104]
MTVLVATENTDGPTRKIAEVIAEALTGRDIEVTVGDLSDLERAEEFEAIVFGGEVEDAQWSPDTREALLAQGRKLSQHLVWLFSAGDDESSDDDETAELIGKLVPRDYKKFRAGAEPDEVRSWVSFIADEIEGHS